MVIPLIEEAKRRFDVIGERKEYIERELTESDVDAEHQSMMMYAPNYPGGGKALELTEERLRAALESWIKWIWETAEQYHANQAKTQTEYAVREEQAITETIWPALVEIFQENPATFLFMEEYGVKSRFVHWFILAIDGGKLAESLLAAYFVGIDVLGNLAPIPEWDGAAHSCAVEESFDCARMRVRYVQAELLKPTVRKIAFLGGGLVPELWTNGFELRPDQSVAIYDLQDLADVAEQLLGAPLQEQNITYDVGDFWRVFETVQESGQGDCDIVVMSGIACYFADNLAQLLAGAMSLLCPGGKILFDMQVRCPGYAFDGLVLRWPATMKLEDSVDTAHARVRQAIIGLPLLLQDVSANVILHGGTNAMPGQKQCVSSGVCFTLEKLLPQG